MNLVIKILSLSILLSTSDPQTISINLGKTSDKCIGRGRICLAESLEDSNKRVGDSVDAIGELSISEEGTFILDLKYILSEDMELELADNLFQLEEDYKITKELQETLGVKGQTTYVIRQGEYPIVKTPSGDYRIIF